jgi:molybdate transport system substrate-binding protein
MLTPAHASAQLLIAAAADLSTLEQPLTAAFHEKSGATARFSFASSGALARQIENGAPFDVFLSANEQFVNELAKAGLLDPSTVRIYAHGRLGLWSKDGRIRRLTDLLDARVVHVAIPNPKLAPYGAAARELLERQGLWKQIEPKVVYGENVRQALQFAETGNAEAVITSWTLLSGKDAVQLPQDHAPIKQSGGVIAASAHAKLARLFLDFLTSPEGRAILNSHGLANSDIIPPKR